MGFRVVLDPFSVTLSVENPLCSCGIIYRRVYEVSTSGLFKTSFPSPLLGCCRVAAQSHTGRAEPDSIVRNGKRSLLEKMHENE